MSEVGSFSYQHFEIVLLLHILPNKKIRLREVKELLKFMLAMTQHCFFSVQEPVPLDVKSVLSDI